MVAEDDEPAVSADPGESGPLGLNSLPRMALISFPIKIALTCDSFNGWGRRRARQGDPELIAS